jgi:hypothetical protein
MSIVSPFGYSEEDIDLSMIDVPPTAEEPLTEAVSIQHKHAGASSSHALPALDEMRIFESVEKILRSFQKKSLTSNEMQTLEHRVWMNLSALKDLPVILRSIALIEEFEIRSYNSSCSLNTSFAAFSIQFHRNLCRLLEEVVFENQETPLDPHGTHPPRRPSPYAPYVEARGQLLRAYDMLVDINSQISLAATAPPGTENNKWGKQNNARAEAICWAARRLAPSTPLAPPQQSLQRLTSTSSMSPSPLMRSLSLRAATDSPEPPSLNSNGNPLTVLSHHVESGLIDKFHETVSLSSANSVTSSPSSVQPVQRMNSSPPPILLHLDSLSGNSASPQRNLPISTFLLFHHCLASKAFQLSPTPTTLATLGAYHFAYEEFVILVDVGEGYLPALPTAHDGPSFESSHMKPNGAVVFEDHSVLNLAHPKVGKEILSFIFLSLLGDVFGLQKFSSSIDLMGLGGGLSLRRSLPLMMAFMEAQPMSIVFNALVNRQLSVSPLQRWIRDTLLDFYGHLTGEEESSDDDTSQFKSQLSGVLSEVLRARTMSSERGAGDSEFEKREGDPTVDEVVKYLLRPAWTQARKSLHLECTMILAAQILEVLEAVSDQLERKSFGEVTLKETRVAWETLIRQLRVVMLLSSRAGGMLSVERLGNGEISIYSLLAADTLCFAMQADQVRHPISFPIPDSPPGCRA